MQKIQQRLTILCFLALLLSLTAHAGEPQQLPTETLTIGDYTLTTEMATTNQQRATGLMHRESMGEYEAMLFVYDQEATRCFWMQNTLIPLTLAYLAPDGTILQLIDMEPETTDSHCSGEPVRYALEVNQSWFERHDLGVGDRVGGL